MKDVKYIVACMLMGSLACQQLTGQSDLTIRDDEPEDDGGPPEPMLRAGRGGRGGHGGGGGQAGEDASDAGVAGHAAAGSGGMAAGGAGAGGSSGVGGAGGTAGVSGSSAGQSGNVSIITAGGGGVSGGGSGGAAASGGSDCRSSVPGASCDLARQCGCTAGQACGVTAVSGMNATVACVPPGTVSPGSVCTKRSDCTAGYACIGAETAICRKYCASNLDCGAKGRCESVVSKASDQSVPITGYKVCVESCSSDSDCGTGCCSNGACLAREQCGVVADVAGLACVAGGTRYSTNVFKELECNQCVTSNCCDSWAACRGNTACICYWDCMLSNADVEVCTTSCGNAGLAPFASVLACIIDGCENSCNLDVDSKQADGQPCTMHADCAGFANGTSKCINFSSGTVCAAVCDQGTDCKSGCCVSLKDGGGACGAAALCQ